MPARIAAKSEQRVIVRAPPRAEIAEGPRARAWGCRPDSVGLAGWCLSAYAFLMPVQIAIGPEARLAPSDLFIAAYLLLRLPRFRFGRRAWSGWHLVLGGSLLVGMLVALLSAGVLTEYAVVQKGVGLAILLATFACLVDFCLDSARRLAWICRVFLIGVLVNLVVALVALYLEQAKIMTFTRINLSGVRLSGLLIDPNAFGGLLVVAISIHFVSRVSGTPLVKGPAGAMLTALLPIGLVLTYSRSAWIGMLVAGATAVWLCGVRLLISFGKVVAVLAVVGILAASVVLPNAEQLASRPEQVEERTSILSDAFGDFASSPVLGVGLGVSNERHGRIIHNTTVWFLAELGPFGLFALVGFLVAYWSKGLYAFRRSSNGPRALAGGLLAAHVGMYGLSMGIEALYQRYWWFLLAGLGALYAQVRRRDEEAAP